MTVKGDLRRELGFWSALTIGAGTMIGAGIFLLSGIAISMAGPAAIFSYLVAGVVCIITAASAAELATGMPTSGGDYFFVSRSLGPAFGAISGIGIWLSLTFAIAFYLVGVGEYLSEFLPLPPVWGAVAAGLLLTALNFIGAKESGSTQVVVVLTLIVILGIYTVGGLFNMDPANLDPFFAHGLPPVFAATALVFISFLGFVKIAAVSEEIKEPSKNLPRALIGSVALVTLLYVLIVLVTAGIFPQGEIEQLHTPLTTAAGFMFGPIGAAVMIFAGLLATTSSANASIMAASRINLAMARDHMIPQWLNEIHPTRMTPYRAILLTGFLALLFLAVDNLETLAEIASVLQLYSYAALNIGMVVLRVANPDWYKPTFRVPAAPYLQAIAALGCLTIILLSGLVAQAIIMALIGISLLFYFTWSRKRVNIEYGLDMFRQRVAESGWGVLFQSPDRYFPEVADQMAPTVRFIDPHSPRRVVVALSNPQHAGDLLSMGRFLATGQSSGGEVYGVHLVNIPVQTPLHVARQRFAEKPALSKAIAQVAEKTNGSSRVSNGYRPISKTTIEPHIDVAHDVFGSLIAETKMRRADLLLMGWQGEFSVSQIYNSSIQRIISHAKADVAVFKDRGLKNMDAILLPWGGGPHAQLGLEYAVRVAEATGATIHILRIVRPSIDAEQERQRVKEKLAPITGDFAHVHYHVPVADNMIESIQSFLDNGGYDLVIIGASHEWRIRNFLFGSVPDLVADYADCSVLMVRRYLMEG